MTRGLVSVFLLLFLGISRHSSAQARVSDEHTVPLRQQPREEIAPAPEWRWYGWQTLTSDGASLATLMTALYLGDSKVLAPASLVGLGFGAPVVHAWHGKPLKALGSVALRIGLPATGILIGFSAARRPPGGDYGNTGALEGIVGFGAGLILASAIDAAALGWTRAPERTSATQLSLLPVLSPDGTRGELRLIGTF